mgnify:FL=1
MKFTHSEQGGVIVLSCLLILLFFIKTWLVPVVNTEPLPSQKEVDQALSLFEPKNIQPPDLIKEIIDRESVKYIGFSFNPNTISFDSLSLMGVDSVLSKRYLKFRLAVGGFKDISDIGRLYGIDSNLLSHINRWAVWPLPDPNTPSPQRSESYNPLKESYSGGNEYRDNLTQRTTVQVLELNMATLDDFKKIRGIGDVLAGRIIKFRESLGGFVSLNQLFAVYGLDSVNVDLENWEIRVDTSQVLKIDINRASVEGLASHPYIDWKQARMLVNFRKQHGLFKNRDNVYATLAFTEDQLTQLIVYLSFE